MMHKLARPLSGRRPLPWREAERIGVWGGTPNAPTKEGSALSGLSRRTPCVSLTGTGARTGLRFPLSHHQRELRPLWTLPTDSACFPDGNRSKKGFKVPLSHHQRDLRPLWTLPPDSACSRDGNRSENGFEVPPKPESTEGRPWGQPLKKPAGAPLNLG